MPSFEDVLGPGEISKSGSSVSDDPGDRSGVLVMGTHSTNGRSSFRLVLYDLDFKPTAASVTRFVVTGYSADHCSGEVQCTENALPANPISFSPPQSNNYGHYFFAANAHDNGILTGLLAQCGCDTAGVHSVKVIVQVEVIPSPDPPVDMQFEFCFECRLEVAKGDRRKEDEPV